MKSYLILLKLNADENSYFSLTNYLKTANYWARPMPNVWIIKTNLNSAQIRDGITEHLGMFDKLLVVSGNSDDWATLRLDQTINDWLKNNL